MTEALDRLPPHDLSAERALLASCWLDRDVLREVRHEVRESDFFSLDHAALWRVTAALCDAGQPIDAVVVRSELVRRGELEAVGGTAMLAEILSSVPSAANGPVYAKIVRELAAWRSLIRVGDRLLAVAYRPDLRKSQSPGDVAAKAAAWLADVGAGGAGDGFRSLADIADEVLAGLGRDSGRFVPTGWPKLDEVIGGLPVGGMTLVGGRPMMGKSWFCKELIRNLSAAGVRCAHISVEEDARKVAENILSAESGVPNHLVRFCRLTSSHHQQQLAAGAERLRTRCVVINDRVGTLAEAQAAIAVAAHKYKAQVVVVDYLQLLVHSGGGDSENYKLTQISNGLKLAFKQAGVCGVVPCQLNRGNERERVPPPPTLSNLRGTGTLEQDGDVILLLHSEDYYRRTELGYTPTNELQVIVAKNKNGRLGTKIFRTDYEHQRLSAVGADEADEVPDFSN